MTTDERAAHFREVGARILEHRYRYYGLDAAVLTDSEYDYLERYYELLARELAVTATAIDMVGFDPSHPGALDAKVRVDTGTDSMSRWAREMEPIWARLGLPKALMVETAVNAGDIEMSRSYQVQQGILA